LDVLSVAIGARRSRRRKYAKEKAGRVGVKVKRGSHLEPSTDSQCPRCDRGLHETCIRGPKCGGVRERSPPGNNKRKQERETRRKEKAAKKAAKALGKDAAPEWVAIDEWLFAVADDCRGYHDGDGKYTLRIPIEDFGAHFYPGGELRLNMTGGVSETAYRLPAARPLPGSHVIVRVQAILGGVVGRLTLVAGFHVRRACM